MAKSTKPQGATSYKETAFGILPRSKVVEFEKKGVKKTLEYILELSSKKATVGDFEPPHYSKVPELVKNLCDDLEIRLEHIPSPSNGENFLREVIALLARFQHRLVWIHPFNDYNGRVARLITNLLTLNLGLPATEIKAETGKDKQNYIGAMKAADKHDLSKLEKLIANALKESLEKV